MPAPPARTRRPAAVVFCLIALSVWPPIARADAVRLTAVSVQPADDTVRIVITTSAPARFIRREVDPRLVVIDVEMATLGMPAGQLPFRGSLVSQVRVGQYRPGTARVVAQLARPALVRVSPGEGGSAFTIAVSPSTGRRADVRDDGIIAAHGPAPARVTGIAVWGTPDRPWVSITATAAVRYIRRDIESDRVVIDVSPAELALGDGALPAGRGVLTRVRAGQFASGIVRVVLELAQPRSVHLAASPDRRSIVATPAAASGAGAAADALAALSDAHTAVAAAPAVRPAAAAPGPYLLGPEDVLEISVWGYPDMTRAVTVRPDGQVAVPLAGTVPAAGRSVEALTQDLTRAYARYIIKPQVTVIVKEFRKIRVSVLGQVTHPGTYTLPPGARVLDAVSAASGVTDVAALSQTQLVRTSGTARPVNLETLLTQEDERENLGLQAGDTLLIPEDTKSKFYVLGDVNRPGVYPIKGDVTVLQALGSAGGPVMHGASMSRTAHIVRRVDPEQAPVTASLRAGEVQPIANGGGVLITLDIRKMMDGDLRQNEAVRPGDVLVVPAPGVAALQTILSVVSTIFLGLRP